MKFKTYAEAQGNISLAELKLLATVTSMMEHFPEDDDYGLDHRGEKVILSCHVVVRAVALIIGHQVKIVDGFFFPSFEHSWLVTEQGNVIDVYPVGTVGGPRWIDQVVARGEVPATLFGKPFRFGLYLPHSILVRNIFKTSGLKRRSRR